MTLCQKLDLFTVVLREPVANKIKYLSNKSNYQNDQSKSNKNKTHKSLLSNFFLSQIVKDVIILEMR